MHRNNRKKIWMNKKNMWIGIFIFFLVTAIGCTAYILHGQYQKWKAEELFLQMAELTTITTETEVINPTEEGETLKETDYEKSIRLLKEQYGITVPKKNIDFDQLHEGYTEDIYAWIYIPNTNVNYPVLQHPADNSYYLNYNLDGSEGYPGCIYTENYNSKSFDDKNTVIYGHNMRDGTMFSDLHLYEEQEFFDKNPYVFIYTENRVFAYQIFAAYQSGNAHLLLGFDISTIEKFLNYLTGVVTYESENRIVNRDIQFDEKSRILSLSTCVMEIRQPQVRYIVQAVLLDTQE